MRVVGLVGAVAVTMAFPRTACQTHSPRPRRALELETCAVVRQVYALSILLASILQDASELRLGAWWGLLSTAWGVTVGLQRSVFSNENSALVVSVPSGAHAVSFLSESSLLS